MKPNRLHSKDVTKTPMVRVDWIDSTSTGRWRNELPDEAELCAKVSTVGYMIHRCKSAVVIAQSVGPVGDFLDCNSIPVGCIRKIQRLELVPVESWRVVKKRKRSRRK